ncbi:unnamed protein product [Laminaria digitata]
MNKTLDYKRGAKINGASETRTYIHATHCMEQIGTRQTTTVQPKYRERITQPTTDTQAHLRSEALLPGPALQLLRNPAGLVLRRGPYHPDVLRQDLPTALATKRTTASLHVVADWKRVLDGDETGSLKHVEHYDCS